MLSIVAKPHFYFSSNLDLPAMLVEAGQTTWLGKDLFSFGLFTVRNSSQQFCIQTDKLLPVEIACPSFFIYRMAAAAHAAQIEANK